LSKSAPLVLLNVRADEASEYSENHKIVKRLSGLEKLKDVEKKSLIFLEDIIHLTKKEEVMLRQSINYDAHHKAQKIFCIAHTVHKNSLWSLISLFNYLVFTSSPSNGPLLRVVLNYFKLDEQAVQAYVDFFRTSRKTLNSPYPYFYFNTSTMTFGYSTNFLLQGTLQKIVLPQDADSSESDVLHAKNIQNQLVDKSKLLFRDLSSTHPHHTEACAIFAIVLPSLLSATSNEKKTEQFLNSNDLTVNFKSQQGLIRISLVDYILDLVTPPATAAVNQKPSSFALLAMHKYVLTRCSIPSHLIRNICYN
jgi:hypothetical protein